MNISVFSVASFIVRVSLKIYFKKIKVEGLENIPKDSPLLLVGNHQNAFLDPFIIGTIGPVPPYYLTRSDVFNKWTSPLLKLLHMMPIYRIRDGYANLTQNDAIFHTCSSLFKEGKTVLIFPEGNHGEHHYLRPLTKGAARLAIQSQLAIQGKLKIVPVGLNYFKHQESNSKVIMVFGKPVNVSDYLPLYEENKAKGLNALKQAIVDGMKSTLVIPDESDDYEEIKKTKFHESNENLSFSELRNLEMNSSQGPSTPRSNHWLAKIFNPIPFLLIRKVIKGEDDVAFHSSLKFIIGLVMFPLWWIIIFLIFNWLFGIIPGATIVSLMVATLLIDYKWSK